ncbi:MAG: hypothetical protein U0V73_05635 [Acidimicrobiia bacterium]
MLTGPTLTVDERPYQAGDRIMTLRNDRRLGVRNGTCGLISVIDPEQREMSVRTDAGAVLALPARYLDAGHVRHAYATTIHKAQGQTADRAFVLGSDLLYQEAGYVALSRGRTENRIYLVGSEPRPEAHTSEAASPETLDALTQALTVSHAQRLAVDVGIDRNAIRHDLAALIRERDQLQEIARRCPSARTYEIDALSTQRQQLSGHFASTRRDIEQLDQQRGWRHRGDRNAQRLILTNQINNLTDRIGRFDKELERARDEQDQRRDYLTEHRDELHRLPGVQRAIDTRFAQLVDADIANPPPYLRALGVPLHHPKRLADWRQAAEFVEHYRIDHNIADQRNPLGTEPGGAEAILWGMDSQQLEMLTAQVRDPTPEVDLGVELA